MIKPLLLGLILCPLVGAQDRITLLDGTRIDGRVLGLYEDGVSFLPAGEDAARRWPWHAIEHSGLELGAEFPVILRNGDRITGLLSLQDGSHLRLVSDLLPELMVPLASLDRAPPAPVGGGGSDDDATAAAQDEAAAKQDTILEPGDWSGSVALLGTFRQGNVNSTLIRLTAELTRQWAQDRLAAEAGVAYGETDGESTARNARGRGKWDHFYDTDFYSYALAEAEWDEIKELDLRAILGIGMGLNAWRGEGDHRTLDFELGVSGIYEKFATEDVGDWAYAARAAMSYLDKWGKGVLFTQRLEFLLPVNASNEYIARSYTALEMALSESWYLKNVFEVEYQGSPPPDSKSLDLKLLIGVEYKF